MRAKKTLSGVAPEDQIINALKTEFKPVDYQFGSNTIKLSRTGMKHILQRHHPEFWDGSIKRTQSYFAAKTSVGELQNVVMNTLKKNRIKLIKDGNRANLQITGIVDGVEYTLGINRGQVKQLYTPKN